MALISSIIRYYKACIFSFCSVVGGPVIKCLVPSYYIFDKLKKFWKTITISSFIFPILTLCIVSQIFVEEAESIDDS